MTRCTSLLHHVLHLTGTLLLLLVDVVHFLQLCLRSSAVLAAENLFLRKQLAFHQERHVKLRRATNATRFTLVWLARWFDWRQALGIVQPDTFLRWHRQGFRLFWRWKSTPGRPPIPADLQALIRRMAHENPTWGQERIANELLLKLGLRVSPRTVRKYMPKRLDHGRGHRLPSQRWRTFVRNHAQAIVACDFCVVVTATFRLLYVFVLMEHAMRRILHCNMTAHPTASWTLQQLREAIPSHHSYRFLLHDRDSIFSAQLDQSIRNLGLRVLKTPPQSPQANALCERLIGTLRRECLDFMIPLTVDHRTDGGVTIISCADHAQYRQGEAQWTHAQYASWGLRTRMAWAIYLAKARNNLRTAQHAYEQGDFDPCVSRAYFAVSHVEIAALVKLPPFRQECWGHDRVQAEFNRRLIHDQKRFPAALRFIHNDLIGRRHMADYAAPHVSARAAERCLRQATEMVATIATVLESL